LSLSLAIAIACLVAIGFQVGTVFQKIAADRLPKLTLPVQGRTLLAFVTDFMWISAFGLKVGCWIGYLVTLAFAPISIIEPIMGLGLAALALFSRFFLRERLSSGDWIGIFIMVGGLVLLGLSTEKTEVRGLESVSYPWLVITCTFLISLVVAARIYEKRRPGRLNLELILGSASGVMIGVAIMLTRVMLLGLKAGHHLMFGLLLAVVIAINLISVFTSQAGFQRGRAIAVVAMLSVVNKIIAVLGGFFVLGEALPEDTLRGVLRIGSLLMLVAGTAFLARFSGGRVK
jgi:drug/metabolite transporter (DMT)-like permease